MRLLFRLRRELHATSGAAAVARRSRKGKGYMTAKIIPAGERVSLLTAEQIENDCGAAQVALACTIAEGFRLLARPGEAEAAGGCDRVDEEGGVPAQSLGITELVLHRRVVAGRIAGAVRHSGIGASQSDGEIATLRPGARSQRVNGESCTARSPASMSMNNVVSGSTVRSSDVLPTPVGPTRSIFAPRGAVTCSLAVMILVILF